MIKNIIVKPHWMTDLNVKPRFRAWVWVCYEEDGVNRCEIRRGVLKTNYDMGIRFNGTLYKFNFKKLHQEQEIKLKD